MYFEDEERVLSDIIHFSKTNNISNNLTVEIFKLVALRENNRNLSDIETAIIGGFRK